MNSAWRVTAFAAALYFLVGANLPYLPVWLEEGRGFKGWQISAMVAAGTLIRIFAGPVIAARAEQAGLARVLFQLSLVFLLAYVAMVPHSPALVIFALVTIVYVIWGALSPLTEAVLLAGTKGQRPDYGVARALASSSFIIASLAVGALVGRLGPDVVLFWLIGAAVLLAMTSLWLPADAPLATSKPSLGRTLKEGFGLYRNKRVLFAGLGASLIQSAHAYYYNLGSNVWLGQGIGEEHIGALWSIGVAAEVVLLLLSGWLFLRWTPGALILLGGSGAVLRWTITGFAPSLEVLYILQMMHALSFAATHIGILKFLAEEVAEEKVPVAMSINSAIIYGPMMAGFGILVGVFYDHAAVTDGVEQASGYWLMAALAGLGCLCALQIVHRAHPQRIDAGGLTEPS